MRVLIACEESQAVTIAFRKLGHEAYSCDLYPCSGGHPEWHYQQDVRPLLQEYWDMVIAHPTCKYLTNSGVCHLYIGKRKENGIYQPRWDNMREGAKFFNLFLNLPHIPKVAIENPIMHQYAREIIKVPYTQIIQPWMFGHMEQKATCLWLKGLPELEETDNVREQMMKLPDNQRQRLHYLPPSPDREKERSKTFPGIAGAMAQQWGTPCFPTQRVPDGAWWCPQPCNRLHGVDQSSCVVCGSPRR